MCSSCSVKCDECQTDVNTCVACAGNRINSNCECPALTFENNTADCPSCSLKCLTCDSTTYPGCLQCYDSTRQNPPNCECISNYFDDSVSASCQSCSVKCSSCATQASNCISCSTNRATTPTCNCADGYYEKADLTC